MQSSQQQIISRAADWLGEGRHLWLCTILKTWGSSPRPVGAMMAYGLSERAGEESGGRGELVGSLSGGCIEEDFLARLQDGSLMKRFEEEGGPFTVIYGDTAEEQARLKLPCGGQLHVLLEFIKAETGNRQVFRRIADDLAAHNPVCRVVDLNSGTLSIEESEPSPTSAPPTAQLRADALVSLAPPQGGSDSSETFIDAANARAEAEPVSVSGGTLRHRLSPMYQLLLLGAGDVARYVAELALALEYRVTLCDPRPGYLDGWAVAGVETTARLPDDVVRERFGGRYSGVVALAHDPRVDDMALMEALKTDAFYVGAMGSARTSAGRRQRLPELGLGPAEIARLHAPIGLDIGSKTPLEIAIAVMAEVTAARNGAPPLS